MLFQQHGISRQLQLIAAFLVVGRKLELNGIYRLIGFHCHIHNAMQSQRIAPYSKVVMGFSTLQIESREIAALPQFFLKPMKIFSLLDPYRIVNFKIRKFKVIYLSRTVAPLPD